MVLVLFYDLLYSNFGQTDYPQKINEEVDTYGTPYFTHCN